MAERICRTLIGPGMLSRGKRVRPCGLPTTYRCADRDVPVCRWHATSLHAGHSEHKVVKVRRE